MGVGETGVGKMALTRGEWLEFPPPPEILKFSTVVIVVPSILAIMLLDISMCHQNVVWKVCPRLRQKQSERI